MQMDTATYDFLLMVSGALITILLAFISYFLKKHIAATETLTQSVNALNMTVSVLETNQKNYIMANAEKHQAIDCHFQKINERLSDHCDRLTYLQTMMEQKPKTKIK